MSLEFHKGCKLKNIVFIKAYVKFSNEEFDKLSQDDIYEGYRSGLKIDKNKTKDLKYAFAIHNNKIKNVYLIGSWGSDPKIEGRLKFTGTIDQTMQYFVGQDVSFCYPKGAANPIRYMELEFLQNILVYPDEIEDKGLFEGAKKQVTVNAYERSSQARQECINKYGYKCVICDFDFEKIYGEIGQNFIHVHHIKPLSEIDKEYEINPINDLRPVCPNCHAMLHRKVPAYSIEEMKSVIKR